MRQQLLGRQGEVRRAGARAGPTPWVAPGAGQDPKGDVQRGGAGVGGSREASTSQSWEVVPAWRWHTPELRWHSLAQLRRPRSSSGNRMEIGAPAACRAEGTRLAKRGTHDTARAW